MRPCPTAFALVLVGAAFAALAPPQAARLAHTDLFHRGDNGVNTYRIPALVQTKHGTLIAVADARYDSPHDLPARIALVLRRSFDRGMHWEPARTIAAVPAGGVGDASVLLDHSNGRVWCFFNYGPPGIGFPNAQPGTVTGPTTLHLHAMHSDDAGATWSAPVDLTPQVKDPAWQAMFATSGTDIQTRNGRFLVPLDVRFAQGVIHALNAYRDDHGQTWKRGQFIGTGTHQ
ncbi:MAG TPA: sialidase family protein [Terriglobales bacterium]|nr:sialidase family protein [Terriglobales bacterium]